MLYFIMYYIIFTEHTNATEVYEYAKAIQIIVKKKTKKMCDVWHSWSYIKKRKQLFGSLRIDCGGLFEECQITWSYRLTWRWRLIV